MDVMTGIGVDVEIIYLPVIDRRLGPRMFLVGGTWPSSIRFRLSVDGNSS
jgi:hypothetical protein